MVRLTISVAPRRSFRVLVIFPLIITGLALMCAAVSLVCLSSLTVLSIALGARDHHYTETRFASVQPLSRSGFEIGKTGDLAGIVRAPQRAIQFASLEPHPSSLQSLLRRDLRNGTTANVASAPNGIEQGIQFIRFNEPTLAPMAFTQFCLKYPSDCKPQRPLSRNDRIELNPMRWSELESINRTVNSSIHPERNEDGLAGEKWLLGPLRGDCNDYAVTKRHQLMTKGWPARDLLLSEVVTVSGEHHLVTVVRTSSGDLVLDNLTDQIKPWSRTTYRWVRIQTPKNPNYWASIFKQNV